MRDVVRPALALTLVALIAIAGLAALAQLKFSSFLSNSVGERLEIVATTAATDFESAIDLGLRVDEVANGEAILQRARSHDQSIRAIAVFDLDGNVLYSVGDLPSGPVHPSTHEAFRVVVLEDAVEDWSVEADDLIRSGALIEGSFGQPVAGVVVHYPVTAIRGQESAMAGSLLVDALLIGALVVVLVGGIGVLLWLRNGPTASEGGPA